MKIYNYEAAFQSSVNYFNGNELAAEVWLNKYALRNNNNELLENSPDKMHWRLAKEFARIEKNKFKKPLSEEFIFSLFDKFHKIIPQGSVMFGCGNLHQYVSLSNCFCLDDSIVVDSIGGILKTDECIAQISKRRGGVGYDISGLRPKGLSVKNAAKTTTGAISFMSRFSKTGEEIGQEGRRAAQMITISVHHPDILDFIKAKNDKIKVTEANISIRLSDEFLNAVKANEKYETRFPVNSKCPVISKYIEANQIWKEIIFHAWQYAEPGLLFWDRIIKESPADCYKEEGFGSFSTNPCSELILNKDSCRLIAINLFGYVKEPFTENSFFDYQEFYKDAKIAQRLLDDLIDLELEAIQRIINKINNDPESIKIKRNELELWQGFYDNCLKGRRTGLGITALGDVLAALGLKYDSDEAIQESDQIYQTLKFASYQSSIEMSKELKSFPIWDWEKEKNNDFIKRIQQEEIKFGNLNLDGKKLYDDIAKFGRRNIANLTTAPTGTVSLLAKIGPYYGTTSGIEPAFMLNYIRRKKINHDDKITKIDFIDDKGVKWSEFDVYHAGIKLWKDITKKENIKDSPYYKCCAEDLDYLKRIELLSKIIKHVDHNISITINLPENITEKEVGEIYQAAWEKGCKSLTVYRKNCRSGVLIDKNSVVKKFSNNAPKRPKQIPVDLHYLNFNKERWAIAVGLYENSPYEVFICKKFNWEEKNEKGNLYKVKRKHYRLFGIDNNVLCDNICEAFGPDEELISRLVSLSLRHGINQNFLLEQIEKVEGNIHSLGKIASRILKKYIKDGERVNGEECPNCRSVNYVRNCGCKICLDCGFSVC